MPMLNADDESLERAHERVRSAIDHLVREAAGRQAFTEQPLMTDTHTGESRPRPRYGLRMALRLRAEVDTHIRGFVETMRGLGVSWPEIAVEVRGHTDVGHEDVQAVFTEYAAPGQHGGPPWVSWHCRPCGNLITDYGPAESHPDREHGHAANCGRYAAGVRASEHDEEDL